MATEQIRLSPETIEALAEAIAAKLRRRGRPPRPRAPKVQAPLSWKAPEAVQQALDGRTEVTMPELLEALGVPVEARGRGVCTEAGIALYRLGWRVTRRRSDGGRARVYTKP